MDPLSEARTTAIAPRWGRVKDTKMSFALTTWRARLGAPSNGVGATVYSFVPKPTAEISMYGNSIVNLPSVFTQTSSERCTIAPSAVAPSSVITPIRCRKRGRWKCGSSRYPTSPRRSANHSGLPSATGLIRKKGVGLSEKHGIARLIQCPEEPRDAFHSSPVFSGWWCSTRR